MARLAETAERYEDMCQFMHALVKEAKSDLTVEERNLLSVAYKNVIGARRASWRTLNVDDHKQDDAVKLYKDMVESEMEGICKEITELLESVLIKNSKPAKDVSSSNPSEIEPRVFYEKMAGDYYRYLAEFKGAGGYDQKAATFYDSATNDAKDLLPATHPIRLGLALNYSVCCYEILKDTKKACEMAKKAFDEAISKLDQLDEAQYKDSTLIMQLLRDNLTLWTSDNNEQEADDGQDDG